MKWGCMGILSISRAVSLYDQGRWQSKECKVYRFLSLPGLYTWRLCCTGKNPGIDIVVQGRRSCGQAELLVTQLGNRFHCVPVFLAAGEEVLFTRHLEREGRVTILMLIWFSSRSGRLMLQWSHFL